MAGSPKLSTSNVRSNKRRLSGSRLIFVLSMLFLFVVIFTWSEDLLGPLHTANFASREFKNVGDDTIFKEKIDDELYFDAPSTNNYKSKLMERLKKRKGNTIDYEKHTKARTKYQKSSLRQKDSTTESFEQFQIITTDDTIPMPVTGSVVHAADALLCRDSVLNYVINATDLRDECDGLTRAYTQNCHVDEEPDTQPSKNSRQRQRKRRLEMETNPVMRWQQKLRQWSNYYRSWFSALVTMQESLNENEEFTINNLVEIENDSVDDSVERNDMGIDSIDEYYNRMDLAPDSQTNPSVSFYDLARRRTKAEESEEIDEPGRKEKKPLANLALPVNSKHVSEKMLTETLMLQQDNKLMKAVANQTNYTVTEAQADAAASSNAVAEAADFVSNILNDPTSVEARTCCSSILSVFHEICSVDEEELSDRRLFVGVGVIALCGLIKSLIRHFRIRWLPEAAGCILVGVTVGYILTFYPHHDMSFEGDWFLRIMVPPIVFEAALNIDKRSFSRHVVPILFYAVLGTLMATGITAFVVHKGSQYLHCETIPYPEALTFGALISSIDPIAVLSVLSNMGMTDQDTIYVVIFGESLLNDGVAIVLFDTLVHFLDADMIVDSQAVTAAAIHFLVVFIGSLLIGLGYGLVCTLYYWVMRGCQTPLVEVLMFCCWALLPYYVCDGIEWSGIVAVVAAGFVMDMYVVGTEKLIDLPHDETDSDSDYGSGRERMKDRRRHPIFSKEGLLSKEAKTHIAFVTEIIATMMETAIFAYLGLFLFNSRYHWNKNHIIIAISGCCISRAIMIPCLSSIANWITETQQSKPICTFHQLDLTPTSNRSHQAAGVVIDAKMQLVLWFAGLRGAMSFALVENIPLYDGVTGEGTPFKSELKAMTSACIIFTVFFLGGGTFYMMEALGISPKPKSDFSREQQMEMTQLLASAASIDTEDGGYASDENRISQEDRDGSTGTGMYTQTNTPHTHRRPGKPVKRQRNRSIK